MNNNDSIESIIEKVIIDYIVDKVIERICKFNKSALVLFTGASIGFNESIKALRVLKGEGWKFKAVMTKGAEDVLTKSLIKDLLSLEEIITEESNSDIKLLVNNHNFIIIPSLTINTASKVVSCISDNLVTNIISSSMKLGKPIIASINACCPDNKERNTMGFYVTEFYKDEMRKIIESLRNYGINLTISENLEKKVNNVFIKKYNMIERCDHYINNKENIIKIDEKIISRECILNNRNFSIIKVNKNAVITDLAKDEVKRLNLRIIKE